jgi:uncharacterized UPF0160 family protein
MSSFTEGGTLELRRPLKYVESVEDLKRLCRKEATFYLVLNYGLYSLKTIRWDGKVFHVQNHIDESTQELTEVQLFTESNIGIGIERKALKRHQRNTEGKQHLPSALHIK